MPPSALTRLAAIAAAAALAMAACAPAADTVADSPDPRSSAAPSELPVTPSAPTSPPDEAPAEAGPFDFTANIVGGGELDGRSLMNRDVVLWFWAPWCPTCMVEGRDHVSKVIDSLPEGVELVGIAGLSDDQAAVEEFIDWTGTGGAQHVVDEDGSIWAGFNVVLQPAFYFVNDDGTARRAGSGMSAEDLMAEIAWLTES